MTQEHPPVAVVVGAGRGIGRAMSRRFASLGFRVVAGARRPEDAQVLNEELEPTDGCGIEFDITDPDSVVRAAKDVESRFGVVDRLVITAGTTFARDLPEPRSKGPLPELDVEAMTEVLRTNTLGPVLVSQSFLPLLARSPAGGVAMFVSSHRGSIGLTDGPGSISYAVSKAGLNMFVRKLSLSPSRGRTTVFAVHPGWVATDLGGPEAPISVTDAAEGLVELIEGAGPDLNGSFVGPDGEPLPW